MNQGWKQDCRQKYQQPQIYKWYHSNGRKRRGIKEPLNEGEKGEWKSWLETQYSKIEDHGIRFHHFRANKWGKSENSDRCSFLGLQNHCRWWWLQSWLSKTLQRDISLQTKVHKVKAMIFLVVIYECESWTIKEGWAPKYWCFQIVVLEKIIESPLDCREIKPVNSKGNKSWIFIGRTNAKAEAPIL